MKEMANQLKQLEEQLDVKKQKKYKIDILINLCNKLKEVEYQEVRELFLNAYNLLNEISKNPDMKTREYMKSLNVLFKTVRQKYDYTSKGQLKEEYIAVGLAIGVAFGSAFVAINPAFIGIGIPIGLAIGIAIGDRKEKEAKEQDRLY